MAIKEELTAKVREFSVELWGNIPNAYVIPAEYDLTFGNSGKEVEVTILYADISDSTKMVDELSHTRSAEYYKAFLHCASQLIKRNGGEIQAYDGDRVMAAFTGPEQADSAVYAAMEIHYAVAEIINPQFQRTYTNTHRPLKFTAGIDSGSCLAVKVGVRAVGEIAWIGSAANYAAKLNSFDGLDHSYPIRISLQTYQKLSMQLLRIGLQNIWEGPYTNFPNRNHYRTKYASPL